LKTNSKSIDDFSFCSNETDKEFTLKLINYLKSNELESQNKIDELKQVIKQMKTNTNADKQIQFNEAIKRVTDKQIEDFKQKEKD
jgi:hypothetical protein